MRIVTSIVRFHRFATLPVTLTIDALAVGLFDLGQGRIVFLSTLLPPGRATCPHVGYRLDRAFFPIDFFERGSDVAFALRGAMLLSLTAMVGRRKEGETSCRAGPWGREY
jgi:hypothetical protein